ncbi:MAG: nucleotidyl transferase AbiEii/AbiGii toxin family protein [Patescibacteria group bacterium]|nr:nucleotidyl transferase AbiEii/AbiGii toxin family protein [Patescibacteria group bacterium]
MKDFVLNWNEKKILKNISFLKNYGIYLAGGTALALYLGHRTSQDLDFYTPKHFNADTLYKEFKKNFKGEKISEPFKAKDTLKFKLNMTDLSFFRYPYSLIRPLSFWESVKLASPEDIVAMKIEALLTRGLKRDFVDLYFLIERYGVKKILEFTKEKYPETYNEYACITSLTYFEDAEKKIQGRKRIYIYSGVGWREIKKYISEQVKKYQLSLIK